MYEPSINLILTNWFRFMIVNTRLKWYKLEKPYLCGLENKI
jgi:hypothetical protein